MEENFDTFKTPSTVDPTILLPSALQLNKFSYARCKEIEIMEKAISSSGATTKLAFQKLPRHMRRRAMSHNAKRLPRRVREIHLNQMKKSGLPPKQKRPSRKHRRKPSNLLNEYSRRQSKIKWLNTHIWHAKRFHMIEKWGYKLPDRSCDKVFTACYRASKVYCLLQDISYFQCLEINGNKDYIVQEFKKITNEKENLSIGSKAFMSGFREGKTTLYQYGSSLKKPIGIVEFLWRNSECGANSIEKTPALWLWVHPAVYEEVLKTLLNCFNLIKGEREHYFNDSKNVQLKELKAELNRFRLTGNLTNQILQNCFIIYSNENFLSEEFKNFFKSTNDTVNNQMKNWEQLKFLTVNTVSPHIILPIIIQDPRLNTLKTRKKPDPAFDINIVPHEREFITADSPLWEDNLRKTINTNKVSSHEIAKLQSSLLVPVDFIDKGHPIPIIMIQKPGNRSDILGYASGWDIILPSSWAQPIWISLIMAGARSGGLREYKHINFEMDKPDFLYPDTSGGEMEEQSLTEYYIKTYFEKPPNKRTNFNKFKIVSPFKFNWKLLIENWLGSTIDSFVVLRDRKMLIDLQKCITLGKSDIYLPNNCLIPVQILCDKGIPKQFAIICLPSKGDLLKVPFETKCIDPNQKKRKAFRDQHKAMLKRLRLKRKKAKLLGKVIKSTNELLKYSKEMKKLWLPDVDNIKNSCSRQVLGFVKEGGFANTLGCGKGIGYIAGAAVNALINSGSKDKVLIRNTNSRQYYLTKLTVITDL